MTRSALLSVTLLAAGLHDQTALLAGDTRAQDPATTITTNLPPWRANASLVAIRAVIWNDKIVATSPLNISLLVKNVSKQEVFALKRFNCNNYLFGHDGKVSAAHADATGPTAEGDYVRLKPGEVMVFTTCLDLDEEAGEGTLRVTFHNNHPLEQQVTPTRDGIPIINHLEYDFGRIVVHRP